MALLPTTKTLTIAFQREPSSDQAGETVIASVVGLTNAQGGTLYIGIDDDGIVAGVRSPKWSDPEKIAAFLMRHTVPPVVVRG